MESEFEFQPTCDLRGKKVVRNKGRISITEYVVGNLLSYVY